MKLVKVKERKVKKRYMGQNLTFLIFDICESSHSESGTTLNFYREIWIQDEEEFLDPKIPEDELDKMRTSA